METDWGHDGPVAGDHAPDVEFKHAGVPSQKPTLVFPIPAGFTTLVADASNGFTVPAKIPGLAQRLLRANGRSDPRQPTPRHTQTFIP